MGLLLLAVELATECQMPNLIKQKTPAEIENGSAVNDVFIQYFSDMLQGKISIEDGVVSLGKEWRNQGGDEILKEVSEVFKTEK